MLAQDNISCIFNLKTYIQAPAYQPFFPNYSLQVLSNFFLKNGDKAPEQVSTFAS